MLTPLDFTWDAQSAIPLGRLFCGLDTLTGELHQTDVCRHNATPSRIPGVVFGPNGRAEPTETDFKRQTEGNNPVVRNVNVSKLPFRKESFDQMSSFKLN
jgi:hypothetical protein